MAVKQEESHVENKHERCNTDEKMGMSTRKINHECTRIYTNALHMGINPWVADATVSSSVAMLP